MDKAPTTITLPATETGYVLTPVLRGNFLIITASARWTSYYVNSEDQNPWATADGYAQHEPSSGYVMPSANECALIGKIGNGPWFLIGSSYRGTCDSDGDLVIQMNDLQGAYSDNAGFAEVTYQIQVPV
jgi:hypothetical protein